MMFNTKEVMDHLHEKFDFEDDDGRIEKSVDSIVDTINVDFEHSTMRPYSHNIIGLCLSSIAEIHSDDMADAVISKIPAISILYKIKPALYE